MYNNIGFVLLACLIPVSAQEEYEQPKNFTAVVTEYNSANDTQKNVDYYVSFISASKYMLKGDIIVFPERTLILSPKGAVPVPDPKDNVIPHKNGTFDKNGPLSRVSETAASYRIYAVVNLFEKVNCTNNYRCPDRGFFLYDTNVAFDRRGMVIARYRKYNVYSGNEVDKPDKPELSTFTTDFGVTFGMFTGFDILFKTPAVDLIQQKNIKHIVFPNRWPGELPFLTGIQVQDGWSYAMNVSLLASGANDVRNGCSGTGIYVARKNKLSTLKEKTATVLMFWGVPTKTLKAPFLQAEPKGQSIKLLEDPSIPQSQGKDLDVNAGKFKDKICHNGLCCNYDLKYRKIQVSDERKYKYRAVAFQGLRKFGANLKHEVAYCAVVLCTDGNCAKQPQDSNYPLEFNDIKIDADFEKNNALQFPSTLVWAYNPNNYNIMATLPYNNFTFEKKDVAGTDMVNVAMNLKMGNVKTLITYGIFGRTFE